MVLKSNPSIWEKVGKKLGIWWAWLGKNPAHTLRYIEATPASALVGQMSAVADCSANHRPIRAHRSNLNGVASMFVDKNHGLSMIYRIYTTNFHVKLIFINEITGDHKKIDASNVYILECYGKCYRPRSVVFDNSNATRTTQVCQVSEFWRCKHFYIHFRFIHTLFYVQSSILLPRCGNAIKTTLSKSISLLSFWIEPWQEMWRELVKLYVDNPMSVLLK